MKNNGLDFFGNNAKKRFKEKKSPFKKSKTGKRHAVWIDDDLYKKLKILTIKYEKTNIREFASKAIRHSFDDGTLPKPKL